MPNEVKIRDLRKKEKFQIDDAYLNGYAKLCGWKGTLVYNSLCRHASKNQYSFPSIDLMAEQHGVSRDTIIDGVKSLQEWKIIQVNKTRNSDGIYKNNGYVLVDKSEWKPKPDQVAVVDMEPSRCQQPDQVAVVDYKDTHIKDTHISPLYSPLKKYSSLKDILDADIEDIAQKYKVSSGFVRLQFEKLINYCESKGKTYKNYKSALRNFVLGDMQKQVERRADGKYRAVDGRNIE